jgi:hypothetical protein
LLASALLTMSRANVGNHSSRVSCIFWITSKNSFLAFLTKQQTNKQINWKTVLYTSRQEPWKYT